jgi:FKBP12-rapamycin complex-associated protein
MLQNEMGAAGIHGLYNQTCEDVIKVLRDNKDSLLAVLETFIHDPILSWRIIVGKKGWNRHLSSKVLILIWIQIKKGGIR